MAFTDEEKTDIRRFCGYPAYGSGASGFQSWRFYQAYGTIRTRPLHGNGTRMSHGIGNDCWMTCGVVFVAFSASRQARR